LRRFKIGNPFLSYEDLLQQAYICFFDIIPEYDPKKGSLEGFFLLSFRRHVIDLLRKMPPKFSYLKDVEDNTPNPLDILIIQESNKEIDKELSTILSEDENEMYNKYLKQGIFDYIEIAEEEGMSADDAKWLMDAVINKLRQHLEKKG
jgi:RNA polymerase sigma factor (sigma-70 family)